MRGPIPLPCVKIALEYFSYNLYLYEPVMITSDSVHNGNLNYIQNISYKSEFIVVTTPKMFPSVRAARRLIAFKVYVRVCIQNGKNTFQQIRNTTFLHS